MIHIPANMNALTGNLNLSPEAQAALEKEDDMILEKMGYKKELYRGLSAFSNFAFGFTEVAMLASYSGCYTQGLKSGGPVVIFWGFLTTFFFTMIVSFSMAEICSAYPSAGSVYHWSAQLVPAKHAALASYITGWFNFLGNAAGDAAFAYSWASFLNSAIQVSYGIKYGSTELVGVSIAVLFLWSALNIIRIDQVGWINNLAAFVQFFSIFLIVVVLLGVPKQLNSSNFVYTTWYNDTGFNANNSFVMCLGLLSSIFSFSGYEASAHMAEETSGASTSAPKGIIYTCLATGLSGIMLILALLYATIDIDGVLNGETDSAMVNLFLLQCGRGWGQALTWLILANLFFAGLSSVAVTGRITFALMRDKGFPYSEFFAKVHPTYNSPMNAIFFVCVFDCFIQLLPLDSRSGLTAFSAIVALASIGFQISYGIPILLKLMNASTLSSQLFRSQPIPFPTTKMSLGVWSDICGVLSILWLFVTSIFFFFPTEYPVTPINMNWVVVVIAAIFLFGTIYWLYTAKHTFTGPKRQVEGEEDETHGSDEVEEVVITRQVELTEQEAGVSGSKKALKSSKSSKSTGHYYDALETENPML